MTIILLIFLCLSHFPEYLSVFFREHGWISWIQLGLYVWMERAIKRNHERAEFELQIKTQHVPIMFRLRAIWKDTGFSVREYSMCVWVCFIAGKKAIIFWSILWAQISAVSSMHCQSTWYSTATYVCLLIYVHFYWLLHIRSLNIKNKYMILFAGCYFKKTRSENNKLMLMK